MVVVAVCCSLVFAAVVVAVCCSLASAAAVVVVAVCCSLFSAAAVVVACCLLGVAAFVAALSPAQHWGCASLPPASCGPLSDPVHSAAPQPPVATAPGCVRAVVRRDHAVHWMLRCAHQTVNGGSWSESDFCCCCCCCCCHFGHHY